MKYYCIRQQDVADCGAACLATVARQYGLKYSLTKLREMMGTTKAGVNAYGIVQTAKKLGFLAKGVKGEKESLLSGIPLPCIAHMVVDGKFLHYVVIQKITEKNVMIADPAVGLINLTHEEFFGETAGERKKKRGLRNVASCLEKELFAEEKLYQWTGVLLLFTPTKKCLKQKKVKGHCLNFLQLLQTDRELLFYTFLVSMAYTILGILSAFYFQILLDESLPRGSVRALCVLSLSVLFLQLCKTLLNAFRTQFLLCFSQRLSCSLLLRAYRHVLKLPVSFFETRRVGELIARFQDAGKVQEALCAATFTILMDTWMVGIGAVILYRQNGMMFLTVVVMLALYLGIAWAFHKPYERFNQRQMRHNSKFLSHLVESLEGIQTVKAYQAYEKAYAEGETRFFTLLRSVFLLGKVENLQSSLKLAVESTGGIILFWVGAWHVIRGEISVGELVVFQALLVYFLDPLKRLIDLQAKLQTAMVAARRLEEMLELETESLQAGGEEKGNTFRGSIQIRNLSFQYGFEAPVLEGLHLTIEQGEKIALAGESGAGKTTLVKLLLGFYPIEKGEIFISHSLLGEISLHTLRKRIAYVSQETFLFYGTIRENIALGKPNATREEIVEAAKRACAHDFIQKLPMGYETLLEENGANLSGGQRQRLSIARAMLKRPAILILDEATSHLDALTEQAFRQAVQTCDKEMTVIWIAHRFSTMKDCDRIFLLKNGKVAEAGSHEELLSLNGNYAKLVREQML